MSSADRDPAVYLITGPMAAGKSTVARALTQRFERGVYLEGDHFRRTILRGREEITPELTDEAMAQLQVRYDVAAAAADVYAAAGFTVVVEDIVAGPMLAAYRDGIAHRPCHVIVLLPSSDVLAARDAGRASQGYGEWGVDDLRDGFVTGTPRIGIWIDNSDLAPDATVDAILAATPAREDRFEVVAPDPAWPQLAERLATTVRQALGPLDVQVDHVGSTAVPDLVAKPVIDLDVVVPDAGMVAVAIERLRAAGYVYLGDQGITGREAFRRPLGSAPHHLYVVVSGSAAHRDHLDLRDHLRRDPQLRRAYADLKRQLAREHAGDRAAYTAAKAPFITRALAAARGTGRARDTDGAPGEPA